MAGRAEILAREGTVRQVGLHFAIIWLSLAGVCLRLWSGSLPPWQEASAICRPHLSPRQLVCQQFSSQRVLHTVRKLADDIGLRPGGSDAERQAADYLASQLHLLGYQTRQQTDVFAGPGRPATRNLIAVLPNPGRPRKVIIGAHLDSFPCASCRGANDNASGVAVIMEAARLLAPADLPFTLEIVFFGAEERYGGRSLFGAEHYVRSLAPDALPVAMIAVDMVGCGDHLHAWHCDTNGDNLAALVLRSAKAIGVPVNTGRGGSGSDHLPFARVGIPAAWLQRLPDPCNHNARDCSVNVQPDAVAQAGRLLVHTLLALDSKDLSRLGCQP